MGRLTLGAELPSWVDAGLAFDPVRHTWDQLHPTGAVHGSRAVAYRLGQRWRGVRPAAAAPERVLRTAAHR